ncbi:MAG: hypothetical protein ABIJ92_01295 [Candidatus Aenigmatarchaeota archaeon]
MSLKKFLKPTPSKIIILIILGIFLSFMPGVVETMYAGFPLGFVPPSIECIMNAGTADIAAPCIQPEFLWYNFIIDIIIWYIISAVIVAIYHRIKK